MTVPSSIRFAPDVNARLTSYVARHPGWSRSSAADRFVDEALRMEEHPGVLFREGPAGRRACLVGGPDVWEVIRSLQSTKAAEPDLTGDDLVALVEENTGLPSRLVRTALAYYAGYPAEVDALLAHSATIEDAALRRAEAVGDLLGT